MDILWEITWLIGNLEIIWNHQFQVQRCSSVLIMGKWKQNKTQKFKQEKKDGKNEGRSVWCWARKNGRMFLAFIHNLRIFLKFMKFYRSNRFCSILFHPIIFLKWKSWISENVWIDKERPKGGRREHSTYVTHLKGHTDIIREDEYVGEVSTRKDTSSLY